MRSLIRAALRKHNLGKRHQEVLALKNALVENKDWMPPFVAAVRVQTAADVEDYIKRLKQLLPELWVDEGLKEVRFYNCRVIFPKPSAGPHGQ